MRDSNKLWVCLFLPLFGAIPVVIIMVFAAFIEV